MGAMVVVIVLVLFVISFFVYARWLENQWGIDPNRKTPAHLINDGVDYVPTKPLVLFGHHFSSIAGAAPVVGAITAAMFGWVPVAIWILIASIFIGGVHDFSSLFASVRHGGRSIGEVIKVHVGDGGKKLFAAFAWFTDILLIAAFLDIVAGTFISTPPAATASVLFIILAILFGLATNKFRVPLGIATVVGVTLVFLSVWVGIMYPLNIPKAVWIWALILYVYVASITPVWILLQPRDYLNSFLLYAMMIGTLVGILIYRPDFQLPMFTGFVVSGRPLFPILFVTLACGAISGFHALVSSGTTAKQLDNEKDAKIVGFGGMLLEGVLALIALTTIAYLAPSVSSEYLRNGAIYVFSHGVGTFVSRFGIPFEIAQTFGALTLSVFAMTTLDTATRLARFIFQEYFTSGESATGEVRQSVMASKHVSTLFSCALGGFLAFYGYQRIWPIFGSANQLLASLTLLTMILWMRSMKRKYIMFVVPMFFMAAATISALIFNIIVFFPSNMPLVVIAALLLIMATVLFAKAAKAFREQETLYAGEVQVQVD